jgi:hypothetical protein
MATSLILAFIDSRIDKARRKAKIRRRNNDEKGKRLHSTQSAVGQKTTIGSYIYAIVVDGAVRYIGKGRNGRMYSHLIEAKRTSTRCPAETDHLYPRMHRKLVETVRAGSQIIETVITSGLTDRAAYRLESRMIGGYRGPRHHASRVQVGFRDMGGGDRADCRRGEDRRPLSRTWQEGRLRRGSVACSESLRAVGPYAEAPRAFAIVE